MKIAEEQWDRVAKGTETEKAKQPAGGKKYAARRAQFVVAVADHAKELLTAEQVERLKQMLTGSRFKVERQQLESN